MLENEFEIFYIEGWRENVIICYFRNQMRNFSKIDKCTFVIDILKLFIQRVGKIIIQFDNDKYTFKKKKLDNLYNKTKQKKYTQSLQNNIIICCFLNQMLIVKN